MKNLKWYKYLLTTVFAISQLIMPAAVANDGDTSLKTKKVILALTQTASYKEHPEIKTGIWLEEATNFYDVLKKSGFEVVFASVNGGNIPIDPRSLKADDATLQIANSDEFKIGIKNSKSFANLNATDFEAIYFCGGHGAMWDLPYDKNVQNLALNIYNNGGYISSVCHGEAALIGLKDNNGEPLVKGIKINGFTNEEEGDASKLLPYSPEDEIIKLGAIFVKSDPYTEFAVSDKRFITGQNPMSSRKVATLLVEALKN